MKNAKKLFAGIVLCIATQSPLFSAKQNPQPEKSNLQRIYENKHVRRATLSACLGIITYYLGKEASHALLRHVANNTLALLPDTVSPYRFMNTVTEFPLEGFQDIRFFGNCYINRISMSTFLYKQLKGSVIADGIEKLDMLPPRIGKFIAKILRSFFDAYYAHKLIAYKENAKMNLIADISTKLPLWYKPFVDAGSFVAYSRLADPVIGSLVISACILVTVEVISEISSYFW